MNQKQVFKRILIVLLSIILLLGIFNIISFADITESERGKIIVENVEPKVEVSVYKLTKVNYNFTGSNQPLEPPYEWDDKVKKWLESNYPTYMDPKAFQKDVGEDTTKIADFYDHLASAIKSSKIDLSSAGTGNATEGVLGEANQTVTIAGLEMGTYLVLIENGYKVYRPSVVNLVPTFDDNAHTWKMSTPATVEIKSSELTITKAVDNDNVNASTTDTLTYTIIADVPNYPERSLAKNYYITDIFGKGLKFVGESTVNVYGLSVGEEDTAVGTKLIEGDNQDYVLTTASATRPCGNKENATFSIEFKYDKIKKYKKVKVVYQAKLKQAEETVLAGNGNINNAYLDYSNNPYDKNSWNTQTISEEVYTYQIELSKIDNIQKGFLTGAHFTLSTSANGDNPITFIKLSDGTYYKSDYSTKGTFELITDLEVGNTGANKGKLYIRGLDTGTYYLTETTAPEGYNKLSKSTEIKISNGENSKIDVENKKGFVLPRTGGSGTVIFTIVGSVLFGMGLLLGIVTSIKKSKLGKGAK